MPNASLHLARRNRALDVAAAFSPVLLLPLMGILGSSIAVGKFAHQAQAEVASDPSTLLGSIAAGMKAIVFAAAGAKVIGYAAVGTKASAHAASGIKAVGYVAAGIKAIGHLAAGTKVATGIKTITYAAARTKAAAHVAAAVKATGHVAAVSALAVAKNGRGAITAAAALTAYRTGLAVGRASANASPDDQDSTNQDATSEGDEGLASDNLFYNLEP